jgi:hypothetical protein
MKEVQCSFCSDVFLASRSDAKRCPSCRNKYLQEYRQKETTKDRRKKQHRELREQAFAGYGGKCQCCGEHRFEFLAIDHVNGGGREERKTKSTQQIARKVVNQGFPSSYRVLCHNCNQSHGWYGYCPHQQERTA